MARFFLVIFKGEANEWFYMIPSHSLNSYQQVAKIFMKLEIRKI